MPIPHPRPRRVFYRWRPGHCDSRGTCPMSAIRFAHLAHRFGERTVLRAIHLALTDRRVGIVGANGSGKSPLARMINGLVTPDEGSVTVAGLDVATRGREVRRQV